MYESKTDIYTYIQSFTPIKRKYIYICIYAYEKREMRILRIRQAGKMESQYD